MIPNPLLDRMEVISIAGYITDEKVHIARDYLEKATRETCGIKPEQVCLIETSLVASLSSSPVHIHYRVNSFVFFPLPIFDIQKQTLVCRENVRNMIGQECNFLK